MKETKYNGVLLRHYGILYRKIRIILIVVLISLLCLLTSCGNYTVRYFPVKKEPSLPMLVETWGRLVLVDGYIRLSPWGVGRGDLIIWPYGYTLDSEGNKIKIINEKSEIAAYVGEWVVMGGGEAVNEAHVEDIIGQPLPEDAKGPYWLAGQVKKLEINIVPKSCKETQ